MTAEADGAHGLLIGFHSICSSEVRMKITFGATVAGVVIVASHLSAALPMRVAILVDTGAATSSAIAQIRAGVTAFLDALPTQDEVLLATTGGSTRVRVAPTTDRRKLKDNIKGVLSDNGPTLLMDSLVEIDHRYMRNAAGRWPVFVIISGDGSDSSIRTDASAFNDWIAEIADRGVSANAIVLKTSRYNLPDFVARQGLSSRVTLTPSGNGLAELIATTLVKATGGHYSVMSNGNALSETMKQLADQLINDVALHE
jgi:hypothetical protein